MSIEILGEAWHRMPVVCPVCNAIPFEPFLRGQVHRSPYRWGLLGMLLRWMRPHSALICWACKSIVGYEGGD